MVEEVPRGDGASDEEVEARTSHLTRKRASKDPVHFEAALQRALSSIPPQDPLIGEVLDGRYRLVSAIAKGGMGRIYAAEHLTLGTRLAVKTLLAADAPADHIERFRREAKAAARLRSPHIASVLDFGELRDGKLYFVMERLLGEDLGKLLSRERPLSPARALHILRQVANALDVAHAQGIVHRDLKPANIFLTADLIYDEFVKVLDFGLAKQVLHPTGSLTEAGAALGTPGFMPPEQALGGDGQAVTPASDVYSLAAVALEMLTGELPYPEAPYTEMLRTLVSDEPRMPSQIGLFVEGLDDVFKRGLARDPDERFESASGFVEALFEVLDRHSKGLLTSAHPSHIRALLPPVDSSRSELPTLDSNPPLVPATAIVTALPQEELAPDKPTPRVAVPPPAFDVPEPAQPLLHRLIWPAVALLTAAGGFALGLLF